MNEFDEFCKAWKKEFPGQDLPTVWEEDTRSNLLRHKKNLEYLKSEIRKEEFYVKFLEGILSKAENNKQQHVPAHPIETVANDSLLTCDKDLTATANSSSESFKPDFVTVISITNKLENVHESAKQVTDKPKAPPKPAKNYMRSISDSPAKSKPEDVVAWTKQQIQQLQTKQSLKSESSGLPPSSQLNHDIIGTGPRNRVSYENVKKPKSDYENVLNDFPSK